MTDHIDEIFDDQDPTPTAKVETVILTPDQEYAKFNDMIEKMTIPIESTPQANATIAISEATPAQIDRALQDRIAAIGAAAFFARIMEVGSYENLLFFISTQGSSERLRTQNALAKLTPDDRDALAYSYVNKESGHVVADSIAADSSVSGKITGGARGIARITGMRGKKVRRIQLVNSGFVIDVRAPTPDDLNLLLMRCQLDTEEYGRRIGAVYYAYFDLILKQNFIQMVVDLTINSTLKDWEGTGQLIQSIKLQDLNHILQQLAGLTYPDGWTGFRHICTRPADPEHPNGCGHVEEITGDVFRFKRVRMAKLSSEAIDLLSQARRVDAQVTRQHLDAYQKALGYDGRQIVFKDWTFTLKTPTLSDHLEAGEIFNRDILNEVDAKNRDGIAGALQFRHLRTYLPMISVASTTNPAGEAVWTDEKDIISGILDDLMSDPDVESQLAAQFISFMDDSQLTIVCYPTFTCPSCGYEPEASYIPLDAASTFFTLAWQKRTDVLSPKGQSVG